MSEADTNKKPPGEHIPGRRAEDHGTVEVRPGPHQDAIRIKEPDGSRALYLFGVVRSGARWQLLRRREEDDRSLDRVRYRDLEALVRRHDFELPEDTKDGVLAHQRVVDEVMRRETVLPAPYGIIFRGRRDLIAFLEDQYLVVDEALSLVEGHWELRLHLSSSLPGQVRREEADLASQVYTELRRHARSALPFAPDGERLFSAAFLVDRNEWVEFWERAEDLGSSVPELVFDLTGPWPPYDFVRMVR